MQQIRNVWAGLDTRRQIMAIGAVLMVLVSVFTLFRMVSTPTMTLLYGGLEGRAAGETVRALEGMNVPYEVRGGAIYVPATQRDRLRMTLAGEGLPASGARGYELLDSLSGFGTTSQMFDAAYWRAKEGELARTIVASPFVAQARVHIANRESSPFRNDGEPTASVSVIPAGAPVTPAQANAIRYLVASAVAGMDIANVAVIDANGTVIGPAENPTGLNAAEERAQTLRERVLRLVEARVGRGNAVVEVSVETVTETESLRERRFDPEGRIAISTDIEERNDSSSNRSGGGVTVASNLPDGEGSVGDKSSESRNSTRERINYEVSQTELEILRVPGAVKRLSVAVLVNGLQEGGEAGEAPFEPRPQEELDALEALVKSAVGFDAGRGDTITIKSMELPAPEPAGSSADPSLIQRLGLDVMSLVQGLVLALVAVILGLFVVRPILGNREVPALAAPAALPPAMAPDDTAVRGPVHIGEIETGGAPPFGSDGAETTGRIVAGTEPARLDGETENPVERLRALIGERQSETVEILRGWLEEREERTR